MAEATATPTITEPSDFTGRKEIVQGTLAVSASPATYVTGGIPCSFAGFDDIKSGSAPDTVDVKSQPAAGTSPSGYVYLFCPGTTQANGLLSIFEAPTSGPDPLVEITNGGAIPAGVSGDNIYFKAQFPRL